MRKYALLFPGQSIHQQKKISSFFISNKIVQKIFDESSEYAKCNFLKLIKDDPQQKLKNSKYSQLFTLILSIAIYKVWNNQQTKHPIFIAGHSLGEYSALVCSKSLQLSDAIRLIIVRYKFMTEVMSKKVGLMTIIIGLNENSIKKILKEQHNLKEVSIACINSSHQIVISGEKKCVEKINLICKKLGAKLINLPIYPPSHCTLMKPASKKLSNILQQIKFKIPIYSVISSTSLKIQNSEKSIRSSLTEQLYKTVKWNSLVQYIQKNISIFIEVSTEKVLTNLNEHIIKKSKSISISLNNKINFLNALKLFKLKYK